MVNLLKNHQLIKGTQTLIQGGPGPYVKEMSLLPSLETIHEVNESVIERTTIQNAVISSDEVHGDGEDENVIPTLEENVVGEL